MQRSVGETARVSTRQSNLMDATLNWFRRYAAKYNFIRLIQINRLIIHFGPWRVVPRFLIRHFRPPAKALDSEKYSLLPAINSHAVAEELRQNSVAVVGQLPEELVKYLRDKTDSLPLEEYPLMHHVDEDIRRLSDDAAIKGVLRAYFRAEPELLECNLVITEGREYKGLQTRFHFDFAGWESLNVFVYLTDVTCDCSYHSIAQGSHNSIRFRDLLRPSIPDDEACERFGSSVRDIIGPAGTLFFENTEAFHRRHSGNDRRVMLNMLFASHRSWLSHGRSSYRQIMKRDKAYAKLTSVTSKLGTPPD